MSKHLLETLQSLDESLSDEALKNRKAALEFTADYLWRMYIGLCWTIETLQESKVLFEAINKPWTEEYFLNVCEEIGDFLTRCLVVRSDPPPDLSPESLSPLIRSDYKPPLDTRRKESPNLKDEREKHLVLLPLTGAHGPMADHFLKFHKIYKVLAQNPEFRPSYEAQMNLNVLSLTEKCLSWMWDTSIKNFFEPHERNQGNLKNKLKAEVRRQKHKQAFDRLLEKDKTKTLNYAISKIMKGVEDTETKKHPPGWGKDTIRKNLLSYLEIQQRYPGHKQKK